MELSVPDAFAPAVLAALLCGVAFRAKKSAKGTELRNGSHVVSGSLATARHICHAAKRAELLGAPGSSQMDEVEEWLEAAARLDAPALLPLLERCLASRTFLAGASLTLADIAVYCMVRGEAGRGQTLSRWISLIESRLPIDLAAKLAWTGGSNAAAPAPGASSAAPCSALPAASAPTAAAPTAAAASDSASQSQPQPPQKKSKSFGSAAAAAAAMAAAKSSKAEPAAAAAAVKSVTNIGGGGDSGSMPVLPDAEMGKVVTRFPPEPSGYLHIGHVKAVLLNDYYARAYAGHLIIRFDDTNPSKEKDEYEQNIVADLAALGVKGDVVSHTSDFFDLIADYARQFIRDGHAFMDDTPQEQMREERMKLIESVHRNDSMESNLARFEALLVAKEGDDATKWCLRARIDMSDPNGTMRDPVIYRANHTPHHRTGTKYVAYPTYDFACPIVDSIEGVTHALRSSEYHDRDKQFYWMLNALKLRPVIIKDFSRLNFNFTLLSKRKLNWFVENKIVDGWYDARFPTVQGMLRRGLVVPALREFILSQGASKRSVDMEWDKLWSTNKKHVDPVSARYTALVADERVLLRLTSGEGLPAPGAPPEVRLAPLHPKNAALGVKDSHFSRDVWLEAADADTLVEGEEITLMKWGNAVITRVVRSSSGSGGSGSGIVVELEGTLNLAGDFKKTEKKVTWLPAVSAGSSSAPPPRTLGSPLARTASGGTGPSEALLVPVELVEYDCLIRVPKLEEGDDFTAAINPVTELRTAAVGEAAMAIGIKAGDTVQIERKGLYRCDEVGGPRGIVLFFIPDGKVKGLFGLEDKAAAAAARRAERTAAWQVAETTTTA